MLKMSTRPARFALNGATMGTRWSAIFYAPATFETAAVHRALQMVVDEVDAQMSVWKPDSDLMRLNAAPHGDWVRVPLRLFDVVQAALEIGRASSGAFDITMGDAVGAWGFGPNAADAAQIKAALQTPRRPALELLEMDACKVAMRKLAPVTLDLNGIAKGYGVDCLAGVLRAHGITSSLVSIDGELRATGLQPDRTPWPIAVEAPDLDRRAAHSVMALQDAAIATSGDYRHWVDVQGRRLSHTMDPTKGCPLAASPASVTVVAQSCMLADAWATAFMVLGREAGLALAKGCGLDVLFLERGVAGEVIPSHAGRLFAD